MSNTLLNEVTAPGFNPATLYPSPDTASAKEKRDKIVALKADSGCLVGCVIQYILCKDQNPGQGSVVCDVNYQNCIAGCQGSVGGS